MNYELPFGMGYIHVHPDEIGWYFANRCPRLYRWILGNAQEGTCYHWVQDDGSQHSAQGPYIGRARVWLHHLSDEQLQATTKACGEFDDRDQEHVRHATLLETLYRDGTIHRPTQPTQPTRQTLDWVAHETPGAGIGNLNALGQVVIGNGQELVGHDNFYNAPVPVATPVREVEDQTGRTTYLNIRQVITDNALLDNATQNPWGTQYAGQFTHATVPTERDTITGERLDLLHQDHRVEENGWVVTWPNYPAGDPVITPPNDRWTVTGGYQHRYDEYNYTLEWRSRTGATRAGAIRIPCAAVMPGGAQRASRLIMDRVQGVRQDITDAEMREIMPTLYMGVDTPAANDALALQNTQRPNGNDRVYPLYATQPTTIPLDGNPIYHYFRGDRYPVYFDRIVTRRFDDPAAT